jgi:hypothetical protein
MRNDMSNTPISLTPPRTPQPMGIAEYKLLESLPAELQTSLPSIEQIERELAGSNIGIADDTQ